MEMVGYFAGKVVKMKDVKSIDIKTGVIANKKEIVVATKDENLRADFTPQNVDLLTKFIDQYNRYVELRAYVDDDE